MLCPQTLDLLFDSHVDTTHGFETRAWRIRLSGDGLSVSTQSIDAASGAYWFHDDNDNDREIRTTYTIQARPHGLCITDVLSPIVDRAFVNFLSTATHVVTKLRFNLAESIVLSFADHCWHLHAGVIAASFGNIGADVGGVCFFDARTRRWLHYLPMREEIDASADVVITRPGEMWVLEKWADPSRLQYYGYSV
jgi:hypothetical protein